MKITKAVITAASKEQHNLPLQKLVDRDGTEKSVLSIFIEETLRAGIEEICIVIRPGDEKAYIAVAGDHSGRLHFVHQPEPLGYGHAVYCANDFANETPVLHLVGHHLNVSRVAEGCAEQVVNVAETENCAVSAVQATRENQLPYYGTVGGRRVHGSKILYHIDKVIEKPTPTEAEQKLMIPGLRASHYLCFFGIHVITPAVFNILGEMFAVAEAPQMVTLSAAFNELAKREQYLALEHPGWRYNLGEKYGLLTAQLALALNGKDRDTVLSKLLELLAEHELGSSIKENIG